MGELCKVTIYKANMQIIIDTINKQLETEILKIVPYTSPQKVNYLGINLARYVQTLISKN